MKRSLLFCFLMISGTSILFAQAGNTCADPIVVAPASLPFTTTDNTSNYGSDVDGAPGNNCGTSNNYLSGDDVFYSFTPAVSENYTFILSNLSGIAAGMFLYADCAGVGTECLEGVGSRDSHNRGFTTFLTAGEDYILAISTYANPQNVGYTLNIQLTPPGIRCSLPIIVGALPFSTTDNTNNYLDDVAGANGNPGSCGTSDIYLTGDDVFYRFTPTISEIYKFTLSSLSTNYSGMFLYADCGDIGVDCLESVGNSSSQDRFFKASLTAGEDYFLVISTYALNSSQQSVGYTLTVEVVPPGEVCANPIIIGGLPFTTTDNTSNYVDDVNGIPGSISSCGANGQYLDGDDVFYRFTADVSTTYEFTLSSLSTSYSGVFLYADCGDVGVDCLAGAGEGNASNRFFTAFLTAGEEYVIAISTFMLDPSLQSVGYTLSIGYAPPGNTCEDPIFVDPNALPFSTTDNTSNYGDDVDGGAGTATCGNDLAFLSGDDVFYNFTPTSSGLFQITLSNLSATGSSIFLFADCADVGSVCVGSFADYTTDDRVFNASLTAGTGYIVVVSSRDPTQSVGYTLTIEEAPPGINCTDPIIVNPASLPFTTTDNTREYGDDVDGVPGSEATCMVSNDNAYLSGDEVFYSFTPSVSDDYTFTLSNLSTGFSGMFLYADCASVGTECLEGVGNNNTNDRVINTSLTAGVAYVLVISTVEAAYQNIGYTLSLEFTPSGIICSSPIIIAPLSLPFTTTDNTNNYSDNVGGSPGSSCGTTSRYLDGDEVFYSITPPVSENYTFTLSNLSGIAAGMFLYADCASVGTECLEGVGSRDSQDRGFTTFLTAGEEYILAISTWAPPQNVGYTLNISGETALPVALTSFTGEVTDKTNKLSWTTAREEAADRYVVERAAAEIDRWEAIGELMTTGNSEAEVRYELIDEDPLPVALYRLKMIDLDGSYAYSDIVRLENAEVISNQLSVFPVPATNTLTVSFTAKASGAANIQLTDLNGRTISQQEVAVGLGLVTETVDLTQVQSGVYLVRVVVDGRQLLRRVIRQ